MRWHGVASLTHATQASFAVKAGIESLTALHGCKDGISEKVSTNVAMLLEPEVRHRVAARDCVKKLYSARSKIVHGDRDVSPRNAARDCRVVFTSLVLSLYARHDFLLKLGHDAGLDCFDDLLETLKNSLVRQCHGADAMGLAATFTVLDLEAIVSVKSWFLATSLTAEIVTDPGPRGPETRAETSRSGWMALVSPLFMSSDGWLSGTRPTTSPSDTAIGVELGEFGGIWRMMP